MTAHRNAVVANGELQFDRAPTTGPSLTCARCGAAVTTYYYTVDDTSICSTCKRTLETERSRRKTGLLRAAGYGMGAAVAGAVVYYGVIAITNLEIGIVAILIGYMVGHAVRSGAGGGGRRFQVLAAALTYLSVGMAYSPLVFKGIMEGKATSALTKQHAAATRATSAPAPVRAKRVGAGAFIVGLGAVALFIAVLPIIAVVGSLPSGLISALIIGFGMRRAWRMTADTGTMGPATIAGPFRVGRPPITATA